MSRQQEPKWLAEQPDNILSWQTLSASISPAAPIEPGAVVCDFFRARLKKALSVPNNTLPATVDFTVEREWKSKDGVAGQLISYPSVIPGPRIQAYVLRPADVTGPLPGVLALHCHGNFKPLGKEKIADCENEPLPEVAIYRQRGYEGRAYANELAKQGFIVMVPDAFLWGSRALTRNIVPSFFADVGIKMGDHQRFRSKLPPGENYESMASQLAEDNAFEPYVDSFLRTLGTSLAAVVNLDDRTSVRVLKRISGVKNPDSLSAIGLSGGGNRVGLLMATEPMVKVGVIAGMMSTYENLRASGKWWMHSTLLYPPPVPGAPPWEWPDIVGSHAGIKKLLCLDNDEDPLFTQDGQESARKRLAELYSFAGKPQDFEAKRYPGHHKLDCQMQEEAFSFLKKHA
jgi:dienelactone hydrolase